jgi:3-oxoacyl-[acyl-carrier-protein] synthase-3
MGQSLKRIMDDAGVGTDAIDLFIPHQANARIIEYAAKTFDLPAEKVVMNVQRYGNTSAATIPIALSEVLSEGRAKPGDTLALVGFGAGLTWASCLFDLGTLQAEGAGRTSRETVLTENGVVDGLIA